MLEVERKLARIPPTYVQYLPQVQQYTDLTKLLEGGYHTLIFGITGSGKSTLLLTLLRQLVKKDFNILARDDGGLEATYLLPYIEITYWIPDGCELRVLDCPYRYNVESFDWRRPWEILDRMFDHQFNLVVFDAYCIDPGVSALFWAGLFRALIFKCMQTPRSMKRRLIFSVDELNDLIQPKGYELTKKHGSVRALIEYNIRKLRKHNVTLIATSHRFTQLGISVRSQFSYTIVKKSFGWDAWDFISKSLATQNAKVFWAVLRDVTSMSPEYFYMFDYKNNFDKYVFSDIFRPELDVELKGIVGMLEPRDREAVLEERLRSLVKYVTEMGWMKKTEIAQLWGSSQMTVYNLLKKPQHLAQAEPDASRRSSMEVMGNHGEEENRKEEEG